MPREKWKGIFFILIKKIGLASPSHRKEFENTCMIVEDYFTDLSKTVRCSTVESVHAAITILQVFDKAMVLDTMVPELGIAALRAKISVKIKAYVDKNVKQLKQLLSECKFAEAYTFVSTFEDLIAQYPEMAEFENVNSQGLHCFFFKYLH